MERVVLQRLSDLLRGIGMAWRVIHGDPDLPVDHLAYVSRHARPGTAFVAVRLIKAHPDHSLDDAVGRGATALIHADDVPIPEGAAATAPVRVWVADARLALARLSRTLYPAAPATVAAVTGTNGKTSTGEFTRQIWEQAGHVAASFGTLGLIAPGIQRPYSFTTPGPITLHEAFDEIARDPGVTHVAVEASSHALDQRRAHGVRFRAAAFTNLTQDHLDYHGTMAAYFAAKRQLFEVLMPPGGDVVLNIDDPAGRLLAERAAQRRQRIITTSASGQPATLSVRASQAVPLGYRLALEIDGRRQEAVLPVIGNFQIANALTALGLALATGIDRSRALGALARLAAAPGRLQRVAALAGGGQVFVDYAHSPDALEKALRALREHASGPLSVVFGCGGNRDTGKRPLMGAVASRLADRVIVTDDNPRLEDPAAIRAEVLAAAPDAIDIGDRREAIAAGIEGAGKHGIVLIAGKGHEDGQDVAGVKHPFHDETVIRSLIGEVQR